MKSHRLQRRACTEGTLLNSFRYFDSLSLCEWPRNCKRGASCITPLSLRIRWIRLRSDKLLINRKRERKLKVRVNTS